MKIAILHLTDIHLTDNSNLDAKMHSFVRATVSKISGIQDLFVVLSGDIAFSGKASEYVKARSFLSVFKQLLTSELLGVSIRYIIIPGNHDCNFDASNQLRKNSVEKVNYSTLGEDNSVIDLNLKVQDEFWEFYNLYHPTPADKLFYTISERVSDYSLHFHCINTAWMSQKAESVGDLFFPVKRYDKQLFNDKGLHFGIWHHPYNWFTPNTPENNKQEFEHFIEKIASTHFFGHEHVQSLYSNENKNTGKKINLLSGHVFNEDKKPNISGFQIIIIDCQEQVGSLVKFDWLENAYISGEEKRIELVLTSEAAFIPKDEFLKKILEVKIPLVVEAKRDLKLNDLFVFPDVELSNRETTSFDNYINSQKLLDDEFEYCILEGDSQVGKTSLLSMLFLKLIDSGKYPLMLTGADIKDSNSEKLAKRAFRQQYKGGDKDFDKYMQLDKAKRVMLIDDYQDCRFNPTSTKAFFDDANLKFGKIVSILDAANGLLSSIKAVIKEARFYVIKPLGYKKRNELIERYLNLKKNALTYDEQDFLIELKELFDNVQAILGDKLMPPYPIYILSIIQALQYKPLQQNETSSAYCYQTLIHYALNKSGVTNEALDSYFNFLTELAYEFIVNDVNCITHQQLTQFYITYSERFLCDSYDSIMLTLKRSKILYSDNDGVKFTYEYILYYLSAKKISEILNTESGRIIVQKLLDDLHNERNANILVFITHHSKDVTFIESSLFRMMQVLETAPVITLERTDPFYNEISTFVEEIKQDILENRNPKEERDRNLAERDKLAIERAEKKPAESEHEDEDLKTAMMPFLQSFRSIEIVGQIIKNRKGSLEISRLKEMLTELYTTGFRTIGYYSELLNSLKKEIAEMVQQKVDDIDNRKQIEERTNNFVQMISFRMMLNVFSKLMHSVGNKELKKLYLDVAEKMNTPAAKIVTFSINSYHGTVNPRELNSLVEEFKGNIVALRLLKARVASYVYNRNLDYSSKQKLASILNMTLESKPPQDRKG